VARRPFYRTLAGLDPYSDGFCRLLIHRLCRGSVFASLSGSFIVLVVGIMLASFWAAAGYVLGPLVHDGVALDGYGGAEHWTWGGAALLGIVGFALSCRVASRGLAVTALRDALRPRIVDGARCLVCGYSLAGLQGENFLIVCPECGRTVPIGLGAVDLIEQMMARGELPPEGRFAPPAGANRPGARPE
jgi:hypothetical protein